MVAPNSAAYSNSSAGVAFTAWQSCRAVAFSLAVYSCGKLQRKGLFHDVLLLIFIISVENLLADVVDALADDGFYMVVSQRVENAFSFAAKFNQFTVFQDSKLVGDGTLADIHQAGDVAHAQLGFIQGV